MVEILEQAINSEAIKQAIQLIIIKFYILIPFLYGLGEAIKRTEFISDKHITLVITLLGGVAALLIGDLTAEAFIQGATIGLATSGVYELRKNKQK